MTRWLTHLHRLAATRLAPASLVVLALAIGCDGERGGGGTVVPHGGDGDSGLRPQGDPEGESMAELDLRLDKLVAERASLTRLGDDPDKCVALCELSRAICEVKTKMCSIAESQVTDDEYQDLCRKAKQRCSDASDSCTRCVERSEASAGGEPRLQGPSEAGCEGEPASAE